MMSARRLVFLFLAENFCMDSVSHLNNLNESQRMRFFSNSGKQILQNAITN